MRLALVLSAFVVAAGCVGDDPDGGVPDGNTPDGGGSSSGATPGTDGGASSSSSGGTDPDAGSSPDGGADAPLICEPSLQACGNTCVDLLLSEDHCGRCDRSCGGGICDNGTCLPTRIVSAAGIGDFAVGETEIYFASTEQAANPKLLACPKQGVCTVPRQVGTRQWGFDKLAVLANGGVAFFSAPPQNTFRPAAYVCDPAGCAVSPDTFAGDGLGGFDRLRVHGNDVFATSSKGAIWATCPTKDACDGHELGSGTKPAALITGDDTHVYFEQAPGVVNRCERIDTQNCTPDPVLVTSSDLSDLAMHEGMLYWLKTGREGFNEGKLSRCDPSDDCVGEPIATTLAEPTDLRLDESGIYFRAQGAIMRCAPNDCVGGPLTIVAASEGSRGLQTDTNFVYYAAGESIFRVAK